MNRQKADNDFAGKKMLSIFVVSGLTIFGMSFFMLDGFSSTTASTEVDDLCPNGLCTISTTESIPVGSFVQQSADISDVMVSSNNESFGSLKLLKVKAKDYDLAGNIGTIYVSKDSFVREGISNSNEGANEVLRVMGAGQTNNRALVAFDQSDIEAVTLGKSIESATLKLYVVSNDGEWSDGRYIKINKIQDSWLEGIDQNAPLSNLGSVKGATWDCADASDCVTEWNGGNAVSTPTDSILITNDMNGQWIEFDVTEDVKNFVLGESNNGWVIMKSDEDASGRINFAAKESQINIPQLEIILS